MSGTADENTDANETLTPEETIPAIDAEGNGLEDTPSPEKSPTLEQWTQLVVLLGKLFLAIVTIAYVLGLLIVNFYFGKHGITNISLIRANYVLVGALGGLPFILSIFIVNYFFFVNKELEQYWEGEIAKALIWWLIAVLLFVLMSYGFSRLFKESSLGPFCDFLPILVRSLFIVVLIFFPFIARKICKQWTVKVGIHDYVYFISLIGFIVILLIPLYAKAFANNYYPLVSSHIGGAKPVSVEVYIDEKSAANNSFKGCKLTKKTGEPWKAQIILVSQNEYVLSVGSKGSEQILWVKKDEVKAVRYNNNNEKKAEDDKPPKAEDDTQPKAEDDMQPKAKDDTQPKVASDSNDLRGVTTIKK